MIFYRDPTQLMTHLAEKHGVDAVTGMAGLIGWSQGPSKALGRFDVRTPPKTIDEMYACAANEAERAAIHDVLFGTAMDAIDRFLPDQQKHAVLRGMLAFLAINSTYRGPYTPGSATCLAFALAVPDDTTAMMTKLEGGIGALCDHLHKLFVSSGGEVRYRAKVDKILVENDRVTGVRLRDGSEISAPIVISNLSPDHTLVDLVGTEHLPADMVTRLSGRDHRASFVQIHFALDGLPEFAPPYDFLNEPGMQGSIGIFDSPEEQQRQWEECRRGVVPDNPSMGMQIPSVHDPAMAPRGKHAASAYAYAFPVETPREQHGHLKNEMAEKVIDKITRYAPSKVGGKSVNVYPVNYPASLDFATAADGVIDARNKVESVATTCPDTEHRAGRFLAGAAVAGYITADAVPPGFTLPQGITGPMPHEVADHVAAVALFGKPSNGFLQTINTAAPPITVGSLYSGKTLDLCIPADPICAPGGGDSGAHNLYPASGMTDQAPNYAAEHIAAGNSASSH